MPSHFKTIHLPESEIKSLREKASSGDLYRFFDVRVAIRSDSPELLEFFRQTYRHFRDEAAGEETRTHSYAVLTRDVTPRGPLIIWNENRAYSLVSGNALSDSADIVIFGSILTKITSHFLIHGAALSSHGRALVLSGLSGSGKTTLALELTRRGLRFCSDEIAAISRSTHLIHPFPRAIGTRENTVNLLNNVDFDSSKFHHTTSGERKWMVDIEDIFDAPVGEVCRGEHVILLETTLDGSGRPEMGYHTINIALKRIDHGLIHRLCETEGVEFQSLNIKRNFPFASFRVQKRKEVQRAFLSVCAHHDESILYKVKAVERNPDPRQNPQLFPISSVEAAFELFGNLQNLVPQDGTITPKTAVNSSHVLYELIQAIADMKCHRLLVGNLKKTADCILDLVT